jgi:IS5 family transposase
MLRVYFLQHWFNMSDPGAEEALYESRSMCRFAGFDLVREPVPDESTILGFRHLFPFHGLPKGLCGHLSTPHGHR